MRKCPLHILSLMSAVVCVASGLLAGRSFVRVDLVNSPIGQNTVMAWSIEGHLMVGLLADHEEWHYRSDPAVEWRPLHRALWQNLIGVRWLGIGWGGQGAWNAVPLWLVPVLTAVLPVRWWVLRRRAHASGGRGFAVEAVADSLGGRGDSAKTATEDTEGTEGSSQP